MDRNLYAKPSNNILDPLKYISNKLSEEKPLQIYSEFLTPEITPRSKVNRLSPLDQALLAKKMLEVNTNLVHKPTKPPTGTYTPKGFNTPQKSWGIPFDDTNTPKSAQKLSKKSKFANSLMDSIEQSKQFKDTFGSQFSKIAPQSQTAQNTGREGIVNFGDALQQNEEVERGKSLFQVKVHMNRNLSLPTDKALKRKSIEKGLMMVQSHIEESKQKDESTAEINHIFKPIIPTIPFRHLIFGPEVQLEEFKKFLVMAHKGLVYATKNLKSPSDKFIRSKQVSLPETLPRKSKILFLDLDETLIHSCLLRNKPDVVLTYQGNTGEPTKVNFDNYQAEMIYKAITNQAKVSTAYEIAIFTASANSYAKTIVSYIDKDKKYISAIFSRENCMETRNGFYIKDLRIVKDKELKDMILVDNLVHSFGFQIENGVPILEFLDNKRDQELKYLADYLLEAANHDDIREFNKQKLKLREMAETNIDDILAQIN